jgi:hypothetical protein
MKRISYAEDHLVTGDDIADAVMAYAQALAMTGRSDSIDVPAVDGSGAARHYSVLIGPASQMLTSDSLTFEEARGGEIRDERLVADLADRTRALAGPAPVPVPVGTDPVSLETEQYDVAFESEQFGVAEDDGSDGAAHEGGPGPVR